jgi:quercetin dioxygenase-like cupin family protein
VLDSKTNRKIRIACLTAAFTVLAFNEGAIAAQDKMSSDSTQPNVSMPVTELHWGPTGVTAPNGTGSLQAAPAFGDLSKGEHGTFIKMPAGFVSAIHTHTQAYFGVVITGVGANSAVGGKTISLPPGSYWFQPGGKPHVTKCISTTECIFFIHQGDKFDYLPVAH